MHTPLRMPRLEPVPIPTKHVLWLIAVWRWLTWTRKWILTEDYYWTLTNGTMVKIPKGFVFDGASIPKPTGGLMIILAGYLVAHLGLLVTGTVGVGFGVLMLIAGIFLSPTGILLIPGLLHDYAYKYNRLIMISVSCEFYHEGAGRMFWDAMFRDEAINVNGFHLLNRIAWLALVVCGFVAWRKHRNSKEDAQ